MSPHTTRTEAASTLSEALLDETSLAEVVELREYAAERQPVGATNPNSPAEKPILYLEDYRRVAAAREDPTRLEKLIKDFRWLVLDVAELSFIKGGTYEDVIQEATVGLFKGIRDYNGADAAFKHFARLCMVRQVFTAAKQADRLKHGPLNDALHLDGPCGIGDKREMDTYMDTTPNGELTPEEIVLSKEGLESIVHFVFAKLSAIEYQCLIRLMDGADYQTISAEMDIDLKSIDNAVQRARKKIAKHLAAREAA